MNTKKDFHQKSEEIKADASSGKVSRGAKRESEKVQNFCKKIKSEKEFSKETSNANCWNTQESLLGITELKK